MSRQPQLPPRCPNPKTNSLISDPFSSIPCKDKNSFPRHQKSISQSFIPEEQPAWLDDLLGDWDPSFKLKSHRRAASDSGTVLDALNELPSLNTKKDDKNSSTKSSVATALESTCIYGPNSPRSKEKVSFQESAIVSALSDCASQGPMQYVDADLFISGLPQLDPAKDASGSAGEVNMEVKPLKRHSGQRSRVRKLQYIAELERTVETFQSMVSELAVRVNSLLEQRVYLSLENAQLKQQLARLQQEKLVMDCQYQSLRTQVKGLELCRAFPPNGHKARTHFRSNSVGAGEKLRSEPAWHMLDMGKLHIN